MGLSKADVLKTRLLELGLPGLQIDARRALMNKESAPVLLGGWEGGKDDKGMLGECELLPLLFSSPSLQLKRRDFLHSLLPPSPPSLPPPFPSHHLNPPFRVLVLELLLLLQRLPMLLLLLLLLRRFTCPAARPQTPALELLCC